MPEDTPIAEDASFGNLSNIRSYIAKIYKKNTPDPTKEMLRIDKAIRKHFAHLTKDYSLMTVVKEMRRVLFHAGKSRQIGHLLEAYTVAGLNGRISADENDFLNWAIKAKNEGFRSATIAKFYEAYDKLRERDGFTHLEARKRKAPTRQTIRDRMEKLLKEPKYRGWETGRVNIEQVMEDLSKESIPEDEYDGKIVDFSTVRDTLGEMKSIAKEKRQQTMLPKYQQFRVDRNPKYRR